MNGLTEAGDILDTGNSGTTTRLMSGILAGRDFQSILNGDESIRSRPMGRVIDPLRQMGARISARDDGRLAPIVFHGGELHGIDFSQPVASAQVKSCLLFAGMRAEGTTTVRSPAPTWVEADIRTVSLLLIKYDYNNNYNRRSKKAPRRDGDFGNAMQKGARGGKWRHE